MCSTMYHYSLNCWELRIFNSRSLYTNINFIILYLNNYVISAKYTCTQNLPSCLQDTQVCPPALLSTRHPGVSTRPPVYKTSKFVHLPSCLQDTQVCPPALLTARHPGLSTRPPVYKTSKFAHLPICLQDTHFCQYTLPVDLSTRHPRFSTCLPADLSTRHPGLPADHRIHTGTYVKPWGGDRCPE